MARKSPKSILKAKGLIPKHWDLRRTPTAYQKRIIRERAIKYETVILHPEKFTSRQFKRSTRDKLRRAGYYGEGNSILIPNFGDKTARTNVSEDFLTIRRTLRNGETVTERVYLHSGPKLLQQLQRKFREPLPPGEYWAFKVGDNNTFLNNYTKDLNQLMRYGERINWVGHPDSQEWAKTHVHLVRFSFDNGRDVNQLPYNPNNPADPSQFKRGKKWRTKRG